MQNAGVIVFGFIFSATAEKRKRVVAEKKKFTNLLSAKPVGKQSRLEKVQKECIEIAMEVARQGSGALIVIGKTKHFKVLFPNFFENSKISVLEKGMEKVLVKLAQIDGALMVNPNGIVKAYGALITKQSTHQGFGTRHSAAKGISMLPNTTSILASEETHAVKIFKEGVQLVEINPHTKGVEKNVSKVVSFINSPEGAVAAGAAIAVPFVGLPGVIVFAGSYYVAKHLLKLAGSNKKPK